MLYSHQQRFDALITSKNVKKVFQLFDFKATSSRILLIGWWLFVVAIIVAYAANFKPILNLADGQCLEKLKYVFMPFFKEYFIIIL
jgi:hypothetical protein